MADNDNQTPENGGAQKSEQLDDGFPEVPAWMRIHGKDDEAPEESQSGDIGPEMAQDADTGYEVSRNLNSGSDEPQDRDSGSEESRTADPDIETPKSSASVESYGAKKTDPPRRPALNVPDMDHGSIEHKNRSGHISADPNVSDERDPYSSSAGYNLENGRSEKRNAGSSVHVRASDRLRHLSGMQRFIIAGILVLCAVLLFAVYKNNRVYTSYEVESEVSRDDDTSVYYHITDSGMIRYSSNGIALMNKNGAQVWDQTYEMTSPVLAVSENYFAVGDRNANSILVFNDMGQCGEVTTDVPLQTIEVSDQGVVAAMLSGTDGNYINLYDRSGNDLVSIKASLDDTGFPEAMSISPDGEHLAASYLKVDSGSIQTSLIFYDFRDASADHVLYTETVGGLYPRVQFAGSSRVVFFGEKGCSIYSVGAEVSKIQDLDFEDDIRSIFLNSQKIGFIFNNNDENGSYRIELYDLTGRLNKTIYFDMDYTDVSNDEDDIVLYNSSQALSYKYNGRLTFRGSFDSGLSYMAPSWETNMYWISDDSSLSEIRAK